LDGYVDCDGLDNKDAVDPYTFPAAGRSHATPPELGAVVGLFEQIAVSGNRSQQVRRGRRHRQAVRPDRAA
jgi:hypothetical protein